MIIGILHCEFFISSCNSLKDKRAILNRIKTRVRNKFNVSIAETDNQNIWRSATVSIVTVSSDKVLVEKLINSVVNYIKSFPEIELNDYEVELI